MMFTSHKKFRRSALAEPLTTSSSSRFQAAADSCFASALHCRRASESGAPSRTCQWLLRIVRSIFWGSSVSGAFPHPSRRKTRGSRGASRSAFATALPFMPPSSPRCRRCIHVDASFPCPSSTVQTTSAVTNTFPARCKDVRLPLRSPRHA